MRIKNRGAGVGALGRKALVPVIVTVGVGAGCGPDLFYLPSLVAGQLEVAGASESVDQAIAGSRLTSEQAAKLRLIQDVRDYAAEVIGLNVADNFTLYYDNTHGVHTYNVSASPPDRLEPVTWEFPVVGVVPYLGYFDLGQAMTQMNALRAKGFDVFSYEVDAYSTFSALPNPIRSSMLELDDLTLIDMVVHELLHATVWRRDDVTFNESLATYFGRTGALAYLRDRFPDRPDALETANGRYEDTDRYNVFMAELYATLDAYYSSDATRAQKVSGREAIFQGQRDRFVDEVQPLMNFPEDYDWIVDLPTNNAWVLGNHRYNLDLDLFGDVFEATGERWKQSLAVFHAAAATADPKGFMREWVAQGTNARIALINDVGSPPTKFEPSPSERCVNWDDANGATRHSTR